MIPLFCTAASTTTGGQPNALSPSLCGESPANRRRVSMAETSLATVQVPPPADTMATTARMMLASRFFGDIKSAEQALVKLKLGQALGIDAFAAMSQIYFVNGKPAMLAGLQARLIKASGKYRYEVKEKTSERCEIEFFEKLDEIGPKGNVVKVWKSIGKEEYTSKDAETAGLLKGPNAKNWTQHRKGMLFARCVTNGFRTHCPDAGMGQTIYLVEELNPNAKVDYSTEGGTVVEIEGEIIDEKKSQRQALAALIADAGSDESKLLAFYAAQSGGKRETLADLTDEEVSHAIDTLQKRLNASGGK